MVFLTSLQSIVPIVLLISLGYILKGRGMFNPSFSGNLSRFIMSVILPAGVFVSVLHHLRTSDLWDLRYGLLVVGITYAVSYVIAYVMMKVLKVPPGRRGIFINMVVNDNCLFIGLPVQIALFGQDALPYFLLYYIGNTISVWMVGVFLIETDPLPDVPEDAYSITSSDQFRSTSGQNVPSSRINAGKVPSKRKFSWRQLLPPPLMGFFAALLFLFFDIPLAPILHNTLNYLGDMVTPLSLIYIGIVLHDAGLKSMKLNKDALGGIAGRFVVSPLIMFGVIFCLTHWGGVVMTPIEIITFVVQSAGPVIAVLPIVANESGADVPFATGLVTISTVLFVIVIPVIMEILTMIGIVA